jgi:hypothetical protein
MALTTRLYPRDRVRAFRSSLVGGRRRIYFPAAGLLVDWLGWRPALRVMVVLMALHVIPAGLFVSRGRAGPSTQAVGPAGRGNYAGVFEAFRSRDVLQMVAMFSVAAMAFSATQVHHVPAMAATGVSLGTATAIASARGFLSLPGRRTSCRQG